MVFESLVADLLNKYLGKYVENLDASQLKIGIWGGNVVLENLLLKDTALDDLDLPIKVVRGYLGKLVLAIPWKNLYNESTVVSIEDLHLLAKPNFDIKYNATKEDKARREKKQHQIESIEEARRIEEEKKLAKEKKTEDQDSFAEKLATNVIKNLQVTIKNIHIRYEDTVSDSSSPFAIGITLDNLSAQTTDKDFIPKIIKESVTMIHKLVRLDYLSVYWNPNEELKQYSKEEWLEFSKQSIASSKSKPEGMQYILKPLLASKKLKINTKPGMDMNIPKMFLSVVLEELGIVLLRGQYHGVVQLLESFERMNRNVPFRRFRPPMVLKKDVKLWWKYCINSILVVDVQRRSKMWSWENIRDHRMMCKRYKESYKQKLLQKTLTKAIQTSLENLEDKLNVVSITIFRQLAENEVMREKKMKSSSKTGGFFAMFTSKEKEPKKTASKIEELMGTDKNEEMKKLYQAIGYSENEVITSFPAEYVANVFHLKLKRISITIRDDTNNKRITDVIRFTLDDIVVDFQQRPSAKAIKVHTKIGAMKLFGTPNTQEVPTMMRNIIKGADIDALPLVDFTFEMNPLNKANIDQSISAVFQPVEIIYDANTVNKAIAFFKPPDHVILQDLQEKASSTFEEFKVSSTAGLLHAMEERTILEVNVHFNASYLIIPENGLYAGCKDMLVIDFGSLHLQSDPCQVRIINSKDIDNIEEAQKNAYDKFLLKLTDLQILLCKEGEDFDVGRDDAESRMHILHPIAFDGRLAKAIVPNDPRLKQISVGGELCGLELFVSDDKLSRAVKLFESLPLPKFEEEKEEDKFSTPSRRISKTISYSNLADAQLMGTPSSYIRIPSPEVVTSDSDDTMFHTPPEDSILRLDSTSGPEFQSEIANQVKIELNFEVTQLKVSIGLTDKETKEERKCVEVIIDNITSLVIMRRWDMYVDASVGSILVTEETWGEAGEPLHLLYTPKDKKMLQFSYRKCEFDQTMNLGLLYLYSQEAHLRALHYKNDYESTQQILDVKASMLYITLHQEALLSVMALIQQILEPLSKTSDKSVATLQKGISSMGSRLNLISPEEKDHRVKHKKIDKKTQTAVDELREKSGLTEETQLKLTASLDGVAVYIKSARTDLANAFVKGLAATVQMKENKTEVKAEMSDLHIHDNCKKTKFPDIISMDANQVFDLEVIIFNEGTTKSKALNMSNVDTIIKASIGQMQAVFLYRFVTDIMRFVDNFEDAKKAIVEAGKAAKERATAAVTEYSSFSSRHQLNIVIRAPTVLIPVHSMSELALLVDLGELRIFNSFKITDKDKGPSEAIITDNMSIKLTELKLLKSLVKNGKDIVAQRALIEPMSLKLIVIRNLTTANHKIPDIDVQGDLKTITLSISEEDISVALKIVNGNLAEGQHKIAAVKKQKTLNRDYSEDNLLDISEVVGQDRLADIFEDEEDSEPAVYVSTTFKFDLEKVVIKLYLKPPDMTFEDEFLERQIELLLSQFTIGHLGVSGKLQSDSSMNVSMFLETLILDDKRPSSETTLTRMMDCCPEALVEVADKFTKEAPNKRMLEVEFSQSGSADKNIDISLNNLLTILNIEFLMVLMRTLQATVPKEEEEESEDSESNVGSPAHSLSSSDGEADMSMADFDTSVSNINVIPPETRLQLSVKNPQIVFLADAKDVKTNSLFLTTEVNFQYLEINNTQKIMGTVINTAVLSTAFQKQHRTDTTQVLTLETVNLHSSAPLGGKQHIHINTTLVKLNISPKTIRTLSACANQTAIPVEEDVRENEKAMLKLWNFNDISNKHLWYLQTPPPKVLSAGSFVLARTPEGDYQNGFLSKQDTHFLVFFYPEGSISHSVSDSTSVVIDACPMDEECMVGENVVAHQTEELGFRTGRIMEIWRGASSSESEIGHEVGHEVLSDEDWEPLDKLDDENTKFLVRFYHDCSEKYFVSEELRLLPRARKNVIPGIGAGVYARFKDGFYYRGVVEQLMDYKVLIDLEEIDSEVEHDRDDPSAIILNLTHREATVKKYFKVIAQKSESSKGYHPGKITAIQGNPGYRSYTVKFEDGTVNQVPISKLLLMPKAPHDALPEIGTYVYSRVARDSPLYEKGIVADKDKDRIYVKHLNGRKLAHDRQMISFVIRNIVPLGSSLRVGQEVIGQVDADDMKMYMGVVKEIVPATKGFKYLIQFVDGSIKKLTAGKVRILSTFGSSNDVDSSNIQTSVARKEQLILEVEGVSISFQVYLGGLLTPVLRFDSRLHAEMSDWSNKLSAYATFSLNGMYYNDKVAEWEPLIEPVIQNNRERPWQLSINYVTEDDNMLESMSKAEGEVALLQKPITTLAIQSQDNLEVTVTRASLALFQDIAKVFGNAVDSVDIVHTIISELDPFYICNKIGKDITITTNEVLQSKTGEHGMVVEKGSSICLRYRSVEQRVYQQQKEKLKQPIISITVDGYKTIPNVVVKRQRLIIYDLIPENILSGGGIYSVVVEVKARDGQRKITIRSPLQIENHFPMPLAISYMNKDREHVKITTIEAGCTYPIPLLPAYHASFNVKPAGFGYHESDNALDWKSFVKQPRQHIVCLPPETNMEPFIMQVLGGIEEYTSVHGMLSDVPRYTLHCHPPILLNNYLPYPIKYRAKGMAKMETLEGGSSWPLYSVNVQDKPVLDLEMSDYLGMKWCGSIAITGCKDEITRTSSFYLISQENGKQMDFGLYSSQEGSLSVTLFAPYWMLNKTGKSLVYQSIGSEATHEHLKTEEGALMFHVKGKKKKARVSVKGCEWSDEFPLDTIGSGGSLKSEGLRARMFEIGVGISLSYFGLTKIVTFTPLRNLTNHTKVAISMAEGDSTTAEWHTVKPGESVPYWPTCLPPKNLYININGVDSQSFNPQPGKTLLLKFRNEVGGVCVNYQEKDSSSLLSFSPYFAGAAPVRIENLCKKISMISYKQVGGLKGHILTYGQSVLYTWDDPTNQHELLCAVIECTESQKQIKLDVNDFGRMKTNNNNAIYWVSFLDGLQRVLLFTDDFKTAYCASEEQTLRPTQEIKLDLEGFGLSLVNSEKRMEIGYLGIRKSKIVWEQFKKRWKTLSGRVCEALEEGYVKYTDGKITAKEKILDMEVDYEKMFFTKPERIKIRRTFHSGIEFKYIISPNRMQIRAAISSLQFDSHVPGSTFLTVIHEVEPPKSVVNDSALKPFFELSLTTNVGDKNIVSQVSYFKVLVQEMDIKIDYGFLLAIIDLFNNENMRGSQKDQYEYDMSIVKQKLEDSPEFQAAKQDNRYVFDYFHLSPLKIHVSFSMTGGHSIDNDQQLSTSMPSNVVNLLMQSVGVAFTEIQDVEFKLACFEVESLLMSKSQLSDHIAKHYQNQAIKQLYVLVLGLDVLGNPYGLITGVGAGAKNFFYEPYQGLIQGPEEFAEGLAYGVKSLVGGTVGGVSGAVSKITGTVGKGLAALTMDDEYQQKRRQQMSQRPTNLGQGLAKGGKGLVKGIFSGVTGVIVKPYEGAKQDGAGGFFKGIGKGLIGVVARPAGGVVDMASNTFEGLKNTTVGIQEIHPMRVARVFHADKILRPFNKYEATGNQILMQTDKGRYSKTDFYVVHVYPADQKNYLILTNKNILYIHKSDILNEWESVWRLSFNEIKGEPVIEQSKITFNLHSTDVKKPVFKKKIICRSALLPTEAFAKWFSSKLDNAKML